MLFNPASAVKLSSWKPLLFYMFKNSFFPKIVKAFYVVYERLLSHLYFIVTKDAFLPPADLEDMTLTSEKENKM